MDLSTIEIDRNTDPENAFDTLVKQLRKQGVKFTKPLANAIKQTKFHREIVRSKTWLQDLIDFLQANRVFLEKSILRDAFYLLFLSLLKMFPLSCRRFFIRLAKSAGIKNPRNLVAIREGRTNTIVMLLPVTKNEFHLIAATTRDRRHYIPPSKADVNFRVQKGRW